MNQKNTSFQLSELKEAGVKLSTVAESYITDVGYTVAGGPASLAPELPYIVMYATIGIIFLAGIWIKTPEKS